VAFLSWNEKASSARRRGDYRARVDIEDGTPPSMKQLCRLWNRRMGSS
jgi:hypothetical protein